MERPSETLIADMRPSEALVEEGGGVVGTLRGGGGVVGKETAHCWLTRFPKELLLNDGMPLGDPPGHHSYT